MSPPELVFVEDDPEDGDLLLRALARAGFTGEVRWARDGEEALAALTPVEAALPRLVLLDLQLPRIDGFEVLTRLRSEPRTRALPVVVFTSSTFPDDAARCRALGADDVIVKPVDFVLFREAVAAIVARWLH